MMPTKRRLLIFLIVLAVMMTAKYLWGQDVNQQVGWDPAEECFGCGNEALGYGQFAMIGGPIAGLAIGLFKAMNRHLAARSGALFSGEMVRLKL